MASADTLTKSKETGVRVGDAHRLLKGHGLDKHPACNNKNFEIWIWPDGQPEIINYNDADCQELFKPDIDAVLAK